MADDIVTALSLSVLSVAFLSAAMCTIVGIRNIFRKGN